MNIAFVDDDATERNRSLPYFLQGFQDNHIPVHRFDFYSSAESFLKNWTLGSYDLIILDILMGDMNGIELGHRIREKNKDVRIVFCSTSNEFANESYDVGACYYIQKPVTKKGVQKMIERFDIDQFEMRRFIVLPDGQRLVLRNMIYSEYSNHAVMIMQKKGHPIKTWIAQNAFAALFTPYGYFVSPNSGNLVNLYEVQELVKNDFVMSDGTHLPISRRRKKEIEAKYHSFLIDMVRSEM